MKRSLLLATFFLCAMASCTKDVQPVLEQSNRYGISMSVFCADPVTKAGISGTKPGEDPYNENKIATIDYYFYPEGHTDQDAVLHNRESVNVTSEYTFNISVDAVMINSILFPRPANTCQVAVLVNYPGNHPSENTKLSDILALALTSDFKESPVQDNFVMFGTSTVNLISRKAKLAATPSVDLHRIASKLTLGVHLASSAIMPVKLVDGSDEYILQQEWVPMASEMKVYLENGVKNGVVSGNPDAVTPQYFKYSQTEFTSTTVNRTVTHETYDTSVVPPVQNGTETIKNAPFTMSKPFYTYPQKWHVGDEKEPFLKLVLPWSRVAGNDGHGHSWGSTQKSFYYRVILPNETTGFQSNNWYQIYLDVAILGSETDDATVDIDATYYVVPWKEDAAVEADIRAARYLSVERTSYTMYNIADLKIPYVTSNTCVIDWDNTTVRKYDFDNRQYVYYTSTAQSSNWITLDANGNIVINHGLNNDISSSTFDCAPYEFSIRIKHSDMDSYNQTVSVIQYPGMYITQEKSNGYAFVKETGNQNQSSTIYDNNTSLANQYRDMGTMVQRSSVNGSGDNNNQYQYTIHVTVLDGSDYVIGDPRSTTASNLNSGINGLNNYKPTAENTQNVIAPVFKIASSYGKTQNMTYEGAQKRCAAYQENGYPAGRWRLPTKAEIEYLMTLSDKEKIPTLFDPEATAGYWAGGKLFMVKNNNGLQFVDANGTTPNNKSYSIGGTTYNVWARCVYDVWYWGDEKDNDHMTTWGGYQTN